MLTTGRLRGASNVLTALSSGCGSSKHHHCDALPMQLGLE
jgi:hypothetical protein